MNCERESRRLLGLPSEEEDDDYPIRRTRTTRRRRAKTDRREEATLAAQLTSTSALQTDTVQATATPGTVALGLSYGSSTAYLPSSSSTTTGTPGHVSRHTPSPAPVYSTNSAHGYATTSGSSTFFTPLPPASSLMTNSAATYPPPYSYSYGQGAAMFPVGGNRPDPYGTMQNNLTLRTAPVQAHVPLRYHDLLPGLAVCENTREEDYLFVTQGTCAEDSAPY